MMKSGFDLLPFAPWLAACLGLVAAGPLMAGEFAIDAYSIAGGGVIQAESDDGHWRMSGTLGQWEATRAREALGGDWVLTGGFWALSLQQRADEIFRDRFETGEERSAQPGAGHR